MQVYLHNYEGGRAEVVRTESGNHVLVFRLNNSDNIHCSLHTGDAPSCINILGANEVELRRLAHAINEAQRPLEPLPERSPFNDYVPIEMPHPDVMPEDYVPLPEESDPNFHVRDVE